MEQRKPTSSWVPLLRAPCAQANPIPDTGPTTEVLQVPIVLLLSLLEAESLDSCWAPGSPT